MTRAVQWYMGFGVCEQQFVSYRSRSEVNPAAAAHGHFRYCRLQAYYSRSIRRRPSNPYTAGRLTSRAIQRCIVLLVCDHCVVSYAPITVIFPLSGSTMCYLGYPIHTKPTQWSYGARCEFLLAPWYPPTTQQPPHCVVMAFWAFECSHRPPGSVRSSHRRKRL